MNKYSWILAGCAAWLTLSFGGLVSAVPEIIELNGTLAWTTTAESTAGIQPFTVRLYDQLIGGTLLWEEHYNVEVDAAGRYSIQLGSGTQGTATNTLSDALDRAGSAAFLEQEIRIHGEIRLFAPRQPLAVAPFAFMAGNAQHATQGFSVEEALKVDGSTTVDSIHAHALTSGETVVSQQTSLTNGTLKCNTLTARTSVEPVVFSSEVVASKDIRVQGNVSIFSMRKPALASMGSNHYVADTDCWLYLDPSTYPAGSDPELLHVEVYGVVSRVYSFQRESYYPVPIPKDSRFAITDSNGTALLLNTDRSHPAVLASGLCPGSFYMCLGVKP